MSSSTKEWDVAAGDVILCEAGGIMAKLDGTKYTYNREDVYNREGYILCNRKENFLI
jgi:3''-Phosphoadenosine 5''-phosphosulfate (PAPS) 3''-phosphatase